MRAFRPAVVYAPLAPPPERRAIEQLMLKERLYYCDEMVERREDVDLPVTARPQLLRYLPWMCPPFVHAFIVDHLSRLGDSPAERLAYLGLLLERDIAVYVECQLYEPARYQMKRQSLKQEDAIIEIQRLLTDEDRPERRVALSIARQEWPTDHVVLPTTLNGTGRSYSDACWRAMDLATTQDCTPTAIARRLSLEGYDNRHRHTGIWNYAAAKQAIADAERYTPAIRSSVPAPRQSILDGVL